MEERSDLFDEEEVDKFKVTDRRHWVHEDHEGEFEEPESEVPSYVKKLQEEAENKDKKLREYIAAFKAKSSEIDEIKERLQRENQTQLDQFKARFFSGLIPIFDNLKRAIDTDSGSDVESLRKGLKMTLDQYSRQLEENGIAPIKAVGRKFNPATDEACMTVPAGEQGQDNMVLEELEPGYMFGDKLLKPVKVKVARSS